MTTCDSNKRNTLFMETTECRKKNKVLSPWASWSPSERSFWWWDRLLTPQTSWWRRSAPCLCFCTWRRRRRSPPQSFLSSRTSPSSGCTSRHPQVKKTKKHFAQEKSKQECFCSWKTRREETQRGFFQQGNREEDWRLMHQHVILLRVHSKRAEINS